MLSFIEEAPDNEALELVAPKLSCVALLFYRRKVRNQIFLTRLFQQEVKVQTERRDIYKLALEVDGNLSHDLVNAVLTGTVALKYRLNDLTW